MDSLVELSKGLKVPFSTAKPRDLRKRTLDGKRRSSRKADRAARKRGAEASVMNPFNSNNMAMGTRYAANPFASVTGGPRSMPVSGSPTALRKSLTGEKGDKRNTKYAAAGLAGAYAGGWGASGAISAIPSLREKSRGVEAARRAARDANAKGPMTSLSAELEANRAAKLAPGAKTLKRVGRAGGALGAVGGLAGYAAYRQSDRSKSMRKKKIAHKSKVRKASYQFDEIEKRLRLPGFGKAPSSSGSSGSDAVAAWNAPFRTPDATKFAPMKRPSKQKLAQRQKDRSYRPSSRNARTTLARRSGAMASPQYSPRVKISDF